MIGKTISHYKIVDKLGEGGIMRKLCYLLLITIVVLGTGCAATTPLNTSIVHYSAPEFSNDEIKNSSMAILPIFTSLSAYEGFKRPIGEQLAVKIQSTHRSLMVNRPYVTSEQIRRAGLTDEYASMLVNYNITGILDADTIQELCAATNSRFLLFAELTAGTSVKTTDIPDVARIMTVLTEIEIYTQIWDRNSGDIVWEGTGGAAYTGTQLNIIDIAIENLASLLGLSLEEAPEPYDAAEIHEKRVSNIINWYIIGGVLAIMASVLFFQPPPF